MAIVNNSYFDGKVKSLGFVANNTAYSVGVMEPGGEYEFDAKRTERIQVVFGDLVDLRDGKHYGGQTNLEANLPPFNAGDKVRLQAVSVVAFICRFDDWPGLSTPATSNSSGV